MVHRTVQVVVLLTALVAANPPTRAQEPASPVGRAVIATTGAADRFPESCAPDDAAGPAAWQEFRSEPGRLRIEFPPGKVETLRQSSDAAGLHEFGMRLPDGVKLAVGYRELSPELLQRRPDPKQRLDAWRNILAAKPAAKVTSERDLTWLRFPGKEVVVESRDGTAIAVERLYMVHNRAYQATVFAPAARFQQDAETIRRFLDSFAPLSIASEDGRLSLQEIEPCYGPKGPVRTNRAYLPFDTIQMRARVLGLTLDEQGAPDVDLTTELADEAGATVFSQTVRIQVAPAAGGAGFDVGLPVPPEPKPGEYAFVVRLKDRRAAREAWFLRQILIRPAELAIVSLEFFQDAEGRTPGPAGGDVSRPFYARLRAIGFDRQSGRIDTEMSMQLFDDGGRPLLQPPLRVVLAHDDPEVVRKSPFVTFSGRLTVDRPGRFRLSIAVLDKIGGKSTSLETPVVVSAPPQE